MSDTLKAPLFALYADGEDITAAINSNLISLGFDDKEGVESDEINFKVWGLYDKPAFGGSLELWLGWSDGALWKCGVFHVNSVERDFKARTTEVRATAVDFASAQKIKKRKTWQNTTLWGVCAAIASENKLLFKGDGADTPIASALQTDKGDIDFAHALCKRLGYLCEVKNDTLIVIGPQNAADTGKDSEGAAKTQASSVPNYEIALSECENFTLSETNREGYTAVEVSWHDAKYGRYKSVKVGSGESVYKMKIPEPKTESEAARMGEAKLNVLSRGGVSARASLSGREIRAGGKISFSGASSLAERVFSVISASHSLDARGGWKLELELEG